MRRKGMDVMVSSYAHGIATSRSGGSIAEPTQCPGNATVIIGTAPINTAKSPYTSVNVPMLAKTKAEAEAAAGYSEEYDRYTLIHGTYAQFNQFGTAPVILINVLDPANEKHLEAVTGQEVALESGRGVIPDTGILLDKLEVSLGDAKCDEGVDFVASFDEDGTVILSAAPDGKLTSAASVVCSYTKINPDGVTAEDIIGGVAEDGTRTGLELVDEIYARFGVIPSILTAPGWSRKPAVAAALEAKAQLIYGLTNAIAVIDLDSGTGGADSYYKVKEQKAKAVVSSRWCVACWPMVRSGSRKIWFSAMQAALMHHLAAGHDGIPSDSPDNKELMIDGVCLEDGTDVHLTQAIVNDYINAYGVVSALRLPTWKSWGNNTAAYPVSTVPNDRWIKAVTMLNYMENRFRVEYLPHVGRNADYRLINDIVNNFNMLLNSWTPDHLAGGSIVFRKDENPVERIQFGRMKFRTRYADYAPAEYIENEFEYDASILEAALEGGEA